MELGKHVVDKELLCRQGLRAGKVDDLVLELPGAEDAPATPEVVAIVTGPLALSRSMSSPIRWLARQTYRLLGLADPRPVELPWGRVAAIDVVVHLDVDRDHAGVMALQRAVERRYIGWLPGA